MSKFWKIVVGVLALLIIAVGGTYYIMNRQAVKEKNDLQAKVDTLNNQVDDTPVADDTADTSLGDTKDTTNVASEKTSPDASKTNAAASAGLSTDSNGISTGKVTIDSATVTALQSAVDAGNQPWRLEPLSLAQGNAASYGFAQEDTTDFTIISQAASAGTAEIAAKHNGKSYQINVIKPVVGDGKIYVIAKISAL